MNRRAAPPRGALLGVGIVFASVVGCSTSSDVVGLAATPIPVTTASRPTTTVAPTTSTSTTTTLPEPDGDGAEVFRRVSPSIAFIETPLASGTAEMIEDGYLVTNAHVVDPFAVVDVEFAGRARLEDVPVVGVDLVSDIAVLGPIADGPPPLDLVSGASYARGSPVFLVGHPAARSDDLDLTITTGVLSRRQDLSDLDLTLLQTDALIVGGQSGGALLDEDGQFIGVSGLFSDGFAFALDGIDVRRSIARILAGDSLPYRSIGLSSLTTVSAPTGPTVTAVTAVVPPLEEPTMLSITATTSDGDETWVTVWSYRGFYASTIEDESGDESNDENDDENGDLLSAVGDDTWEVLLPMNDAIIIETGTLDDEPTTVTMTTSLGVVPYVDDEPWHPLAVSPPGSGSSSTDAVLDAFEHVDTYVIDLVEATPITLTVRSLAADLTFEISALDGDDSLMVDDGPGDAGWWGLDPSSTFTPSTTGTYRIDVKRFTFDPTSTGYRIFVAP